MNKENSTLPKEKTLNLDKMEDNPPHKILDLPTIDLDKLEKFSQMPFYAQKSQEWLDQRNNYLTASTIATALGLTGQVSRRDLLLNKSSLGQMCTFSGNQATRWGNKYEPVANYLYSQRNKVTVHEFGLITNPQYPILGVSPDGITSDEKMLEIKCPYSRKINGKIKKEYYHQIQEQLVVCDYQICDFLECSFEEITQEEYEEEEKDKGIIVLYVNPEEEEIQYSYSLGQKDPLEWLENQKVNSQIIYLGRVFWRLKVYSCQEVTRDPDWIEQNYPLLEQFWSEVEHFRKVGADKIDPPPIKPSFGGQCLL